MNYNLFENQVLDRFDFNKEYVGYTIDNSDFETNFTIKVFIPELFGYNYGEFVMSRNNPDETAISINSGITTYNIIPDNITNKEELNLTNDIESSDYITSRVLIERHSFESLEHFIFCNKPEIGARVLVKFFNGNPLDCIYSNTLFLTDNIDPYQYIKTEPLKSSSSTSSGDINSKTVGDGKVYWYVRK